MELVAIDCIVNGPGETADTDFGFVGGAPGKGATVGLDLVSRPLRGSR